MENQPQTVDIAVHQSLISELVEQRDKALAESANKGAENRLLRARLEQLQPSEQPVDGGEMDDAVDAAESDD